MECRGVIPHDSVWEGVCGYGWRVDVSFVSDVFYTPRC